VTSTESDAVSAATVEWRLLLLLCWLSSPTTATSWRWEGGGTAGGRRLGDAVDPVDLRGSRAGSAGGSAASSVSTPLSVTSTPRSSAAGSAGCRDSRLLSTAARTRRSAGGGTDGGSGSSGW